MRNPTLRQEKSNIKFVVTKENATFAFEKRGSSSVGRA